MKGLFHLELVSYLTGLRFVVLLPSFHFPDLSSLSLQPSGGASSSNAMVKDEYLSRSMDVDGSGGGQPQMGMGMSTPGVSGVVPQMPPAMQQPPPQTIQHHGPPPTPTFTSMMPHPSQNQGQCNELSSCNFFPYGIRKT